MNSYTIENVKDKLCDEKLLCILSPSIYKPTPKRVRARAIQYMNSDANIYAYKENDTFSGIVIFSIEDKTATILDIATDINLRSKGIASKLLDYIFSEFGVISIIAETDDDAVGFYKKYGFNISVCGQIGGVIRYNCICSKFSPCFCGHDCSKCITYIATINNDNELRGKSQKFYKATFGQDIQLGEIHCMGGRSDDMFFLCKDCLWMKCAKEKGLTACSECAEYPCKPLVEYQEKYVNKCNQI